MGEIRPTSETATIKLGRPISQGSTNRFIGLFIILFHRSAVRPGPRFQIFLIRGPYRSAPKNKFCWRNKFSVRGSLLSVYLRIMYYVANISVFKQDLTRFHYYLQIRNDVIDGYITVGNDEATTLASLAIQAELGDYDPNEHTVEFFREFYLFPEALVQDNDETKHQHNIDQLR